ncbi:hypothetical protein [Desulfitobacterium sp.]|uniref:hypothetical protein n=1 Tax=Desulfitobacterium sp. TaxID=49981 RepID=UPI002B2205BB|nr:hypothetical protein [Desulfitobacterium sp.]MEA4901860.1 hypothetical protein [Desulfitobacterium sp.]
MAGVVLLMVGHLLWGCYFSSSFLGLPLPLSAGAAEAAAVGSVAGAGASTLVSTTGCAALFADGAGLL